MAERIRMIVIVSVVTAVVWLFAEAESLTTRTESIRIQFVAGEANEGLLRVRVVDTFAGTASVELTGSQGGIDSARRALGSVLSLDPSDLAFPLADGVYPVDLASVLAASQELSGTGVKVSSTTPARVSVEYTRLEVITVPVRVQFPVIDLEGEPSVEPAEVQVRIPVAMGAAARERIEAIARVPESQLAGLAEGVPISRTVTLTLDDASRQLRDVEMVSPQRATVRFTVESTASEASLASVPVWVVVPPSLSEQWSVELAANQSVVRARVRGPREAVQRMTASETPLIAVVALDSADMLGRVGTKEISWFVRREGQLQPLPRGVEVIEAERSVVNLTITERAPAGG